ncbi:hypothetical protein RHGRI_011103 [Rhododendron griersonianum]|uniref:DOG1 domain-containing protein n=1 Tax=Rhododendron griersonianum TaxID=479676 RepID=A0AAV6KKK8_9ERIC|nr:hypothetical protein RHGRI_011103 [Rhododendron griersonianum]
MSFPISPNPNTTTSNNAVAAFESFFQGWLVQQEHYLDQLLSSQQTSHQSHDSDLRELISQVLSHYQQYYEEKSKLANCDVFLVFSPPWFTPFERTFFWIAGFKPGLAFQVVGNTVGRCRQNNRTMGRADLLQTRMAEKVVGVLSPVQDFRFLAVATQLQQRIRVWGLQKQGERRGSSG